MDCIYAATALWEIATGCTLQSKAGGYVRWVVVSDTVETLADFCIGLELSAMSTRTIVER
jgi:hypothetical protein